MKYLLFLLAPLIAFSFFEEPAYSFDIGVGGGYRQDSMKRHMQFKPNASNNPLPHTTEGSDQSFKHLRAPILYGFITTILNDFVIHAEGDYTWYKSGKQSFTGVFPLAPPTGFIRSTQTAPLKGRACDLYGQLGYRINIIPMEIGDPLYLIPIVGYGWNYQRLHAGSPNPSAVVTATPGLSPVITSNALDQTKFRRDWYGPFIGAQLEFTPEDWLIEAAYYYHNLCLYEVDSELLTLQGFFGGALVADFIINIHDIIAKVRNCYGHRCQGRVRYSFTDNIKVELFSGYLYFATKKESHTRVYTDTTDVASGTVESDFQLNFLRSYWHSFYATLNFVVGF